MVIARGQRRHGEARSERDFVARYEAVGARTRGVVQGPAKLTVEAESPTLDETARQERAREAGADADVLHVVRDLDERIACRIVRVEVPDHADGAGGDGRRMAPALQACPRPRRHERA